MMSWPLIPAPTGRGRQISESKQVPGKPGLRREPLSQKPKPERKKETDNVFHKEEQMMPQLVSSVTKSAVGCFFTETGEIPAHTGLFHLHTSVSLVPAPAQ